MTSSLFYLFSSDVVVLAFSVPSAALTSAAVATSAASSVVLSLSSYKYSNRDALSG
jgi:hypothetical protein